jgi:hypothetical protein
MSLAAAASAAVLVLTGYLVAGLALQHAAYILQYGSVFDALRRWLDRRACSPGSPRLLRWLCGRVRELIACQLCSITQLAIWFCALPVTAAAIELGGARPFGLSAGVAAWGYGLLFVCVAFSAAAVGLLCWDVARLVGRGTEAAVLLLRARKDAAERSSPALAAARGAEPRTLARAGLRPRPAIVARDPRRLTG